MPPTTTRRLADKLIKGGVDAFIAQQREAGGSWFDIAAEIYLVTKGQLKVSPQTVSTWASEKKEAA